MVGATQDVRREKLLVSLSSVGAALGLTGMKLVVGLLTGSLGILTEAAHSGLDLVAALMTLFAVRVASRPADATHHYGHGKVEDLSAFLEAGLLLVTAGWVISEAVRRLLFHEGQVEVTVWSFLVRRSRSPSMSPARGRCCGPPTGRVVRRWRRMASTSARISGARRS
jgi:divalent metal cation (Fe/Co/Zn/Cd) transporter